MEEPAGDVAALERAIGWVRTVVAGFAIVLIVGASTQADGGLADVSTPPASSATVAITAGIVTMGGRQVRGRWPGSSWLVQAIEVAWYLLVASLLADVAPQVAWAVLAVPIVVASLRLGAAAVLASGLVAALGYEAATTPADAASLWGQSEQSLERVAVLLTIATAVAVLARFLQEGWQVQAMATATTGQRRRRLSTIEQAAQAMRGAGPTRVLDYGLAALIELGFDAAISGQVVDDRMSLSAGSFRAAGDGSVVPVDSIDSPPNGPAVEVARWDRPAGPTVYSAMARAPGGDLVFVGWSRSPIDEGLAVSLGDLVATTMAGLTVAHHAQQTRLAAGHDPLTGLINQTELRRRLATGSDRRRSLVVAFVDLDHFHLVNDRHGRQLGDAVLVELADRLRHLDGERFLIARLDGDRFVVAAIGLARDQAAQLAEWIRQTVAAPFLIAGTEQRLSACVGLLWTDQTIEPPDAIRLAGQAADDAKRAGRDRVHIVGSSPRPMVGSRGPALTG